MGVGEGDRTGQQAGFADPLEAGRVTVAIEYMHACETRVLTGGSGAGFDHGDAGQDVATIGGAASHIAVADADAGDISDGVEGAGLELAELNVQVAGTWFHTQALRRVRQQRRTSIRTYAAKEVGSIAVLDVAPGSCADTLDRMGLRLQGEQRGYYCRCGVDVWVILHLSRDQRLGVYVGVGGERQIGSLRNRVWTQHIVDESQPLLGVAAVFHQHQVVGP
ncbi:hypothetical protein D3C78_1275920 [compost metagenome]